MKTLSRFFCFALIATAPLSLTSCGDTAEAVDDTPLEFSREQYVEQISDKACDRFEECGQFGSGKLYADEAECESTLETRFYELWPEAQCGNNQITGSSYDSCLEQAEGFTCETGLASVDDYVTYVSDCNAEKVCTDPSS